MKRGNGEGSVYRDGVYWVAEIEWTDDSGAHRKRRKRTRQHEAIEALTRLRAEIREGTVAVSDRATRTVADVMREYLKEASTRVRPGTLRDYTRISGTQIVPAMGKVRAHSLRRHHVNAFLERVNGDRSKQLAYTVLRAALSPHVRHVDPREHPFPPRSLPKVQKREYVPLSEDAKAKLFASFSNGDVEGTICLVMTATGCRQSEALGLRWADVGEQHIVIRQKLDERSRETSATKTLGSRRRVDVPPFIIKTIDSHRENMRLQHAAFTAWQATPSGTRRRGKPPAGSRCLPDDFVFTNSRGRPIVASNLRRSWRALRKRLNLPDHTKNKDLRHEHGSRLAQANVHPKVVQERLGHSSIRVTMDIYSHLMPGMQQQAVDVVAQMLVPPIVPPKPPAASE